MDKTMDRDKILGLQRQEAYSHCREDTTQYHCKLCQRATHGQFCRHKINISKIYHKPVPQRPILLRPTGRHLWGSHLQNDRAIKKGDPVPVGIKEGLV